MEGVVFFGWIRGGEYLLWKGMNGEGLGKKKGHLTRKLTLGETLVQLHFKKLPLDYISLKLIEVNSTFFNIISSPQVTLHSRQLQSQTANIPVSPCSPYMMMNTLASVPAPETSPVVTPISYVVSEGGSYFIYLCSNNSYRSLESYISLVRLRRTLSLI